MNSLRVFAVRPGKSAEELDQLPETVPADGFLWLACTREQLKADLGAIHAQVEKLSGLRLLDLHISDLLNTQLPSHFDYTSSYDVLVFRRLVDGEAPEVLRRTSGVSPGARSGSDKKPDTANTIIPASRKVQTQPVGFVVFDNVLLSVHPEHCSVMQAYSKRLLLLGQPNRERGIDAPAMPAAGAPRLPDSPAEQALRMVSLMVDAYLDLRKIMTHQLDHWQQRLMRPNVRFDNWGGLLKAQQALHHLYDLCEDQRNAVGAWMDVLEDAPAPRTEDARRQLDQLQVRCRDVLEHIERVSHHIRELERSAETAIQIHFNIQSNRTNDVMRTLTAITAVFLPLNLIAGIFGMNFQFIPWLHAASGFWWALTMMALIAIVLIAYFARKQYLSSTDVE